MSLITALIMIFIMAVIAATILFAVIRIFQPHKRKVYAHQVVKHATDRLPYQDDLYGVEIPDAEPDQDFINLQASGKQKLDQANAYAEMCAASREKAYQDKLKSIHNGLNSDAWIRRVNKE
jgi:hypothetical protein